jgi:hypothetical protein
MRGSVCYAVSNTMGRGWATAGSAWLSWG